MQRYQKKFITLSKSGKVNDSCPRTLPKVGLAIAIPLDTLLVLGPVPTVDEAWTQMAPRLGFNYGSTP